MTEAVGPKEPNEKLRGCLKTGILGCGSALLVFLAMVTFVVSVVSRHPDRYRTVVGKLFDTLEDELAQSFGSDVTPSERAGFTQARERFRRAWSAGELPASAADRLRKRLISASRQGRLGKSDVRELTDLLSDLTARRQTAEPVRPAPAR